MLLHDVLEFYQWNATHVDLNKYFELTRQGLVNIKKHPQFPLYLLNYTPRTQYRQKWCKELVHARGLVVGEDGKILARPLPKFFNHYEIIDLENLQDEEYEVFEKMDGSLVIMFHYENHPIFCTRGSFISEQSAKAHEIFRAKYKHISINRECTYCFEVIYPENKIVVNYEDVEDLFLISITHTSSGKEINIDATGFKTVNKLDKTSLSAFLSGFEEANMEGYVVKYTKGLTNSLRVKYKFNTYVEKHKGKSLSETAIKRSMKNMESINLDNIPDECYEAVKKIKTQMEEQFQRQKSKIENQYLKITSQQNSSPRDVIEAIKQSEHSSILFAIHRKKPYDMLVWKSL
jgi:RNA ligase